MFFMNPDEARAAMHQARMNMTLVMHTFNEMVDSMPVEHLRALTSVFEVCVGNDAAAAQMFGQLVTVLRLKHNTCQCGQDCHKAVDVDIDETIEKLRESIRKPGRIVVLDPEMDVAVVEPFGEKADTEDPVVIIPEGEVFNPEGYDLKSEDDTSS